MVIRFDQAVSFQVGNSSICLLGLGKRIDHIVLRNALIFAQVNKLTLEEDEK
jgi:thiamine pyrophosphokinase